MPLILAWAALGLVGVLGLREINKATDSAAKLLGVGVAAGAVYVAGKRLNAW
tara:strand:- start:1526 stop:1681 length:156 start_codon:yes stop_codon:yes gene_type:complete